MHQAIHPKDKERISRNKTTDHNVNIITLKKLYKPSEVDLFCSKKKDN